MIEDKNWGPLRQEQRDDRVRKSPSIIMVLPLSIMNSVLLSSIKVWPEGRGCAGSVNQSGLMLSCRPGGCRPWDLVVVRLGEGRRRKREGGAGVEEKGEVSEDDVGEVVMVRQPRVEKKQAPRGGKRRERDKAREESGQASEVELVVGAEQQQQQQQHAECNS
ncbi:hypothetical protein BDP55DRAFT_632734 [Colletotrichum godetiae]|uniref:Uncharacterized protein n=1 Tax=Colletotrichum godetiae TaxID=1209918 RepID=A0AAJ0EWX7_9PEZI|nr:uncharacterized protein BDP55DRAFT_632734 [Colletotrichum godetiae]KAK1674664.1 hypothetical protein BDP55DRAFT_632734 [Colletotrichum godetiae]